MTNKQKQAILAYFSCYEGLIDGAWGPLSVQGTKKLQGTLGIPDDGVWGPQTEAAARKAIGEGLEPEKEPEKVATDTNVGDTGGGDFWDGIRYWSREEFGCRCREYYPEPLCDGFPVEPDKTLVQLVDDIRHRAGRPGHRSSGIRCPVHNARQPGAAANSNHLQGKALDFWIEGLSGAQLLQLCREDPRTSYAYIIREGEPYVHVDVG